MLALTLESVLYFRPGFATAVGAITFIARRHVQRIVRLDLTVGSRWTSSSRVLSTLAVRITTATVSQL